MNFYVNWRTALRAIMKNRKRSILTMVGIIIGIAAVITILSLGRGFERETIKNITKSESENLEMNINFMPNDYNLATTSINFFQDSDLSLLRDIPGVAKADYASPDVEYIYREFEIKGRKQHKQIDLVEAEGEKPLYGQSLTTYDNMINSKVVMLDKVTAEEMYTNAEDAVGRGIDIEGQVFLIVGVYAGSEATSMFDMPTENLRMPKNTYLTYFAGDKDNSRVDLTLESGANPAEVMTAAMKALEENGTMRQLGKYEVFDTSMLTEGLGKILSNITYFISAVAGISLFIAGVGVMNMMYISVSERTKEIGIRRALGATQRSIKLQFLLEGMTLTVIGGLIGYLIGIALAYLIGKVINIPVSIDLFTVTLAVGVSSAIGLIFSIIPASEAAKKDLIDIMR